jgi:hypothetical protein
MKTPAQNNRLPFIKTRFEAWKRTPFVINVEWFGEAYSNGIRTLRVTWKYGASGNFRLDGSALVTVGVRGAMTLIHATEGITRKDADTAKYASVMTGLKMKLV